MGMTLEEIKTAIEEGKTVFWSNEGYIVTPSLNCLGYSVTFKYNGYVTPLTESDLQQCFTL